eukprot:709540_1
MSTENATTISFQPSQSCRVPAFSVGRASKISTIIQSDTETSDVDHILDDIILNKHGYKITNVIASTLTGCVYEGTITPDQTNSEQHSNWSRSRIRNRTKIHESERLAIKKSLSRNITKNIEKEAIILHYLSNLNNPPENTLCKYIGCIKQENYIYLIQSYGGKQNLSQLIFTAHQYIIGKKLKIKNWRIVCKLIFWKLSILLYW